MTFHVCAYSVKYWDIPHVSEGLRSVRSADSDSVCAANLVCIIEQKSVSVTFTSHIMCCLSSVNAYSSVLKLK